MPAQANCVRVYCCRLSLDKCSCCARSFFDYMYLYLCSCSPLFFWWPSLRRGQLTRGPVSALPASLCSGGGHTRGRENKVLLVLACRPSKAWCEDADEKTILSTGLFAVLFRLVWTSAERAVLFGLQVDQLELPCAGSLAGQTEEVVRPEWDCKRGSKRSEWLARVASGRTRGR